ncbi:MAG: hypothetical protein HY430_00125 [Candidatus Levybacteria bacterium]|nr:hypothetical protein [Candidatus Levybacteria bacterium]
MFERLPFAKHCSKLYLYKSPSKEQSIVAGIHSKRIWSYTTALLATLCLLLIFFIEYSPAAKLISPIISPLQNFRSWIKNKSSYETFSFAPGWASERKRNRIDYSGLGVLAFFDLPVDADGTFNQDNDGYQTFKSREAKDVFNTAHARGAKVTMTITQTYNADIRAFLDSPSAQQTLMEETISEVKEAEIDGVTIDFEYQGDVESLYKDLFSSFVKDFTEKMHQEVPSSQVSIALGTTTSTNSLYDISQLAITADKVFLMSYSFAVPEAIGTKLSAPQHGHSSEEYTHAMEEYIKAYARYIPEDKLVIERAWYGTGENYPLYKSDTIRPLGSSENQNTLSFPLSRPLTNRLVQNLPFTAREAATKNLPYIAKALEKEGILSSNVLAYALATIEHETAGTFEPISEFKGRKSARRLGYECGTNYYGRGFIQLTHCRNYKKMGERIGLGDALVKNPDLASNPEVAAAVLAAFFKDNNVSYWAERGDFVTARIPINPDAQGWWIATLAWGYLEELG